ncbi:MAG: glutathione S-transferase family protein [Alphaproteobacteria bacterium]|nr:glutathione S-transferase family protein [Alphaproteobacteria bacterium]
MAIEVWWGSGSPFAWRVLLALELKGIDYDSRLISFGDREHKTPAYLARNPRGKVPVLVDGDIVVYESLAILAYLESTYPERALFGTHPAEVARVWRCVAENENYGWALFRRVIRPLYFGTVDRDRDDLFAALPEVHVELARLEGALAEGPWLAGQEATAAECCWYPVLRGLVRAAGKPEADALELGVLPLEATYPRLAAWMGRVEALPGFARTWPPHWGAPPSP